MADKTFAGRVKLKKDTKTNWETKNPVLLNGEIGIATTESRYQLKCGNGASPWNVLPAIDADDKKQADWNTNNGVKNLIEITAESQTINGLTFTVDKNKGTITVNGTATADTEFVFADLSSASLHGSKYILSGSPNGDYLSYWITMSYRPSLSSTSSQLRNYTGDTPCDMTNGYPNSCSITISNGLTISDKVFKPMLRHNFIEDSTFVPYAMNNAEITAMIGDINSVLEGVL